MQITDTIADMLTRIRNANSAKHNSVDIPASNMKKAIAQILVDEGYVKSYQTINDDKQGIIRIFLKYQGPNRPRYCRVFGAFPSRACVYTKCEDMPKARERHRHSHNFHIQGRHDRQAGAQGKWAAKS